MFCPKCNKELIDQAQFCISCGAEVNAGLPEGPESDSFAPAAQPADTQPYAPPVESSYGQPDAASYEPPAAGMYTRTQTGEYPADAVPAYPGTVASGGYPSDGSHGTTAADYSAAPYTPIQQKKGVSGTAIAIIIVGVVFALVIAGVIAVILLAGNGGKTSLSTGTGYDVPEKAIEIYLTALEDDDRESVLKTMSPALIALAEELDYSTDDVINELDYFSGLYGYAIEEYEILGYDSYDQESTESFEDMLSVDISGYDVYYVRVNFADEGEFEMNIDLIKVDGRWGIAEMWQGQVD